MVAMASLVMAISIPFVQRTFRRDAVYQAVKTLEDGCRNARALAIFNNATTELVIRPLDKTVSVHAGASHAVGLPNLRDARAVDVEGRPVPIATHGLKPFSGQLADDVVFELLDVNFVELRGEEEARIRFQPNGTADEFTCAFRVGALAVRKLSLDIVTGLPTLETIR